MEKSLHYYTSELWLILGITQARGRAKKSSELLEAGVRFTIISVSLF